MSRGRAARKGRPVFGAAALYAKERASEDALLAGPHFLDGHRRSRLYRAAIITPNRWPTKFTSQKQIDFLVQLLRRAREAEPLAGAQAPLQRLRSEWL